MKVKKIFLLSMIVLCVGCGDGFGKVELSSLEGDWEIRGRNNILDGSLIRVNKLDNKYIGELILVSNNKLKLYMDSGDIILKDIDRKSNFEFKFTEHRPNSEIFSLYNLVTTFEYEVRYYTDSLLISSGENKGAYFKKVTSKNDSSDIDDQGVFNSVPDFIETANN